MIERKESQPLKPKHGVFYGYIVVIASFCIMALSLGSRNAFGVFFKPMADEFKWSAAATSSAFSLSMFLEGTSGMVMGKLTDKFDPRKVLVLCGILIGAGYLLTSQVNALWQMYLFYGVLLGIGMGGAFVPLVATAARWFKSRRTAMTGIVLSGGNIGMLIASPVANWLISTYNWHTSFIIFGIASPLVIIISALFLRHDPAQIGQEAYGQNEPVVASKTDLSSREFSFNEALRTRQFWLLMLGYFCIGFVVLAMTAHTVPYAIGIGISPATAANAIATIGAANVTGRLVIGAVAEKTGNKRAYLIGFTTCLLGLLCLMLLKNAVGLFIFTALFGLGQGTVGTAQGPLAAELFGLKSYGSIFGVCGFCAVSGGAAGPIITGLLFDITGSYQAAFILWLALCIAGTICISLLTPVRGKERNLTI